METLGNFGNIFGAKKGKKGQIIYNCQYCDFFCSKKYSWDRHIMTSKHKKNAFGNVLEIFGNNLGAESAESAQIKYICDNCPKIFETRSGLWKHKKICENNNQLIENNNEFTENKELINITEKKELINITEKKELNKSSNIDPDILKILLENNTENIKNIVLEVCKHIQPNNINNINSYNCNNNNKTFNLQVFLNETCKDAMNISDFVDSIQLQLSDLENVGKVGYIEGISNIIIKNLKALDVEKRPVHCTDQKREVIYVKEDNIWEKEDETNKKLRKAIKLVAHKNICMLKAFRDKYPDFDDGDSRKSTQYNKIVIEAMGGKGDNEYEKDTKIIKKIAKIIGIEKN